MVRFEVGVMLMFPAALHFLAVRYLKLISCSPSIVGWFLSKSVLSVQNACRFSSNILVGVMAHLGLVDILVASKHAGCQIQSSKIGASYAGVLLSSICMASQTTS